MVRAQRHELVGEPHEFQHARERDAAHATGAALDIEPAAFLHSAFDAAGAARGRHPAAAARAGFGFRSSKFCFFECRSHAARAGIPGPERASSNRNNDPGERPSHGFSRSLLQPKRFSWNRRRPVTRSANRLCPACGDEGVVASFGGGRHFVACCLTCGERNPHAPTGSGPSPLVAVDRWIHAAERAVLRGAA